MLHTLEPVRTIYTEEWVRARSAVEALASADATEPFSAALSQLEAGWEHARQLEGWSELRDGAPDLGEAEDALRWHVEVEVVDLFRWIAGETLQCIPWPATKRVTGSLEDLEMEVESLRRNARLLLLAAQSKHVPAPVRKLARSHAAPLVAWSHRFAETVAAIRRYLDREGIGEKDE